MTMKSIRIGTIPADSPQVESAFDDEGQTIKQVIVCQLAEAMKERALSKAHMAVLLKTSRSQVNRLLDPGKDVTLSTLQRVAKLVGRKLQVHLL